MGRVGGRRLCPAVAAVLTDGVEQGMPLVIANAAGSVIVYLSEWCGRFDEAERVVEMAMPVLRASDQPGLQHAVASTFAHSLGDTGRLDEMRGSVTRLAGESSRYGIELHRPILARSKAGSPMPCRISTPSFVESFVVPSGCC